MRPLYSFLVLSCVVGRIVPETDYAFHSIGRLFIRKLPSCDACVLGTLLDSGGKWRMMLGLSIVPPFIILSSLCLLPESPRWLLGRGHEEEAYIVLCTVSSRSSTRKVKSKRRMMLLGRRRLKRGGGGETGRVAGDAPLFSSCSVKIRYLLQALG